MTVDKGLHTQTGHQVAIGIILHTGTVRFAVTVGLHIHPHHLRFRLQPVAVALVLTQFEAITRFDRSSDPAGFIFLRRLLLAHHLVIKPVVQHPGVYVSAGLVCVIGIPGAVQSHAVTGNLTT